MLQISINKELVDDITEEGIIVNGRKYKFDEPLKEYARYNAQMDSKTCIICAKFHGSVYRIDAADKPSVPIHPRCRCWYDYFSKRPVPGQIPSPLDLPPHIGRAIFGPKRWELFQSANLGWDDLIKDGKILPLDEVQKRASKKIASSEIIRIKNKFKEEYDIELESKIDNVKLTADAFKIMDEVAIEKLPEIDLESDTLKKIVLYEDRETTIKGRYIPPSREIQLNVWGLNFKKTEDIYKFTNYFIHEVSHSKFYRLYRLGKSSEWIKTFKKTDKNFYEDFKQFLENRGYGYKSDYMICNEGFAYCRAYYKLNGEVEKNLGVLLGGRKTVEKKIKEKLNNFELY